MHTRSFTSLEHRVNALDAMLLIHASGRSPMPTTQRTIATYNVNGIASRLPHLLQWLQREQPDIVGLQEGLR